MKVNEATIARIRELSKAQRLSMYELSYRTGMPPSTVKSIMNGKSKNPGIVNIKKIAEGFMTAKCLTIWNKMSKSLGNRAIAQEFGAMALFYSVRNGVKYVAGVI